MQPDYTTFKIPGFVEPPSFAREPAYTYPETDDQLLFDELSKISEEVLECRRQNFVV